MKKHLILFNENDSPRFSEEIINKIASFKNYYIETTHTLIQNSTVLNEDGETLLKMVLWFSPSSG